MLELCFTIIGCYILGNGAHSAGCIFTQNHVLCSPNYEYFGTFFGRISIYFIEFRGKYKTNRPSNQKFNSPLTVSASWNFQKQFTCLRVQNYVTSQTVFCLCVHVQDERSVNEMHFPILLCSVNICFTSTYYRFANFHSNIVVLVVLRILTRRGVWCCYTLVVCVFVRECRCRILFYQIIQHRLSDCYVKNEEKKLVFVQLVISKVVGNP